MAYLSTFNFFEAEPIAEILIVHGTHAWAN